MIPAMIGDLQERFRLGSRPMVVWPPIVPFATTLSPDETSGLPGGPAPESRVSGGCVGPTVIRSRPNDGVE